MAQFGLCGGTYTSESPQVDAEEVFNWYAEVPESAGAKTPVALYPTPGKSVFCTLIGPSVRGLFPFQGMLFAVSGATFYQISASGTKTVLGTVQSDNNPISWAAGPNQIAFTSAGGLYVWNYTTRVFIQVPITTLFAPTVLQIVYLDGFNVILFANSDAFQFSNPDDATTWPLINVGEV